MCIFEKNMCQTHHELRNHTMEVGSLVSKTFFAGAKGAEVLCRLGRDVGTELEGDASHVLASDFHIKLCAKFREMGINDGKNM